MKKGKGPITKWLYWFLFAVAIIAVYKTLDNFTEIKAWIQEFFSVLSPFIGGILIAYLLYIPCKKVEQTIQKIKLKPIQKRARSISVLCVYLIVAILLLIAFRFILPSIIQSIIDLVANFQEYYKQTMIQLEQMPQDSILNQPILKEALENISNIDLKEWINITKLTEYAEGAIHFASSIFTAFVTIIVSVYILIERKQIIEFLRKVAEALFPKETYQSIGHYFDRTNEIFFKFLASQCLDALVVGIITSIAMSIMGVKYAILLGCMIGIFNLIPYFGAIIAVIIAVIITLLTGGIGQAILMAIVVTILQQIDANIINPKIVGNSLKISPLLVIFAVTIGGAYFGILGMFLAVPIIAVIKLFLTDYIEYKNREKTI